MTALRILLVGDYPDDPRLGSAKVAHKLREEFRAAGHECEAIFADAIGRSPANRQLRQLVGPAKASAAISRAVDAGRFDVVDASSAEGLWFGIARRLGRHPRTALVCRSHGLEHLNYRRMLDDSRAGIRAKGWTRRVWYPASRLSQVAMAARLADRLVLLNDADRAFALARGWQPADRIDVIPHGVSGRFLAGGAATGPRGAGALFCGTWDHMKGVRYLADAFSQLTAEGRPVPLTVLGPGVPPAQVLAEFSDAARAHVTVADRVPEEAVIDACRRHDLLAFPSTYEGFGLVVIEAMSQGLPVVATPVGCAATVVRDGITGRVVPVRDSRALASAVADLIASPAERARLGAAAAQAVAGMSWRATAERTLECYREAIASAREGRAA